MALAFAETFVRLAGRVGFPSDVDLVGGAFEEADFSVSLEAAAEDFGNGKRYIVTLGSVLSSFSFSSIGKSPLLIWLQRTLQLLCHNREQVHGPHGALGPVETRANPVRWISCNLSQQAAAPKSHALHC